MFTFISDPEASSWLANHFLDLGLEFISPDARLHALHDSPLLCFMLEIIFVFSCMSAVFMLICTWMCLHVCACECQGQRAASLVITQVLPIFCCLLETDSLPGWELSSRLDWLSSDPQESTCLSLPIPKITSEYHHSRLFFLYTQALMLARPHASPS